MNLGDFHTLVSTEINAGTTLDAQIPGAVRRAALYIERNYDMAYMRKADNSLSWIANDRRILLPADFKRDEHLKVASPEDVNRVLGHLRKVDEGDYLDLYEDTTETQTGTAARPKAFTLFPETQPDGSIRYAILSVPIPDAAYRLRMTYYAWTSWPTDLSRTHFLLSYGEDALLARTMQNLASTYRDQEMVALWRPAFEEGIRTLLQHDTELAEAGKLESMQFGGDETW
jgi:hypothetical protein